MRMPKKKSSYYFGSNFLGFNYNSTSQVSMWHETSVCGSYP